VILCTMYLRFELIDVSSLKGRRSVLNGIKERLKSYNVSLLDLSGEYPKEAELALAFLSPDRAAAAQYRERIEATLERHFPEWPCDIEYEEL
jgi:uncharacterized protein YlxP (DUF503 family)